MMETPGNAMKSSYSLHALMHTKSSVTLLNGPISPTVKEQLPPVGHEVGAVTLMKQFRSLAKMILKADTFFAEEHCVEDDEVFGYVRLRSNARPTTTGADG